jgi:oxygen-independent coproporphyrinogen-3 oxidase
LLKEAGVTRLSLGFQTLDDTILRHSGRDVSVRECLEAYEQARDAGFEQINIDLLAGLPGEHTASWRRTIDRVLDLAPDCVTIYQLELTHNSPLHHSMEAGRKVSLPDWPTKRAWVADAFETLEHVGYTIASGYMAVRDPKRWRFSYTVDHFWRGEDLLALGETSFGHIQGVHYQNAHTFDRYVGLLDLGQLPWRRAYELSAEEKLRREVILQLKTGALDAAYFRRKFGIELTEHFANELSELTQREWLEIDGDSIRLTRHALLDVDWLLPAFYLPQHRGIRYT